MIMDSGRIAIIDGERVITYHELLQYIHVFSERLDINPGAVVMIYSEPRIGYLMALYAIWAKRGKYNTFYHNLTMYDLLWALDDVKPAVIFTSNSQLSKVNDAVMLSQMPIEILVLDDLEQISITPDTPLAEINHSPDHVAAIIYTAGVTGEHYPALMTFGNYFFNAQALIDNGFVKKDDKTIVLLPFYNTWVLLSTVLTPLYLGATCVFCHSYDANVVTEVLQKNHIDCFVCVNAIYTNLIKWTLGIVNSSKFNKLKFKVSKALHIHWLSKFLFRDIQKKFGGSLRYFLTVGTQVSEEVWQHFHALGFDVYEGYGMQETANLVTIPVSKRENPQSAGKFIEGVNYKIIDREIVLNGPNVTKSYYERYNINKARFNGDWFFTGDEGKLDDEGYLYISSRAGETITLRSGKLVFPLDLEKELLERSSYVKEVGVFYDADILKVIIVPTTEMIEEFGTDNDYEKIFNYVKWQVVENYNYSVPAHKRIKKIIIAEEGLGRSTSGKLKRYLLYDHTVSREKDWWLTEHLENML